MGAPDKVVRHFRQILLWPLHLMPVRVGVQIQKHWELLQGAGQDSPWREVADEFTGDPGEFKERHYGELPGFLQEVCEFAESVSKGWDHPDARAKINERFGAEGLTELAFAIAAARVFPTIKRAMGYAQSCSVTGISLNGKYVKQQTSGQGNAGLLAA